MALPQAFALLSSLQYLVATKLTLLKIMRQWQFNWNTLLPNGPVPFLPVRWGLKLTKLLSSR
eukprot:2473194-Amphidinium_carterae.2